MARTLEKTDYEPHSRFLLEICYDGSGYSGWQIQPHCRTVQEVIQQLLSRIYNGTKIELVGSSRTDAGVHAQGFAASYLTPPSPAVPGEKIRRALNRLLPGDIKIMSLKEVPLEFHTRFDALGKAYTYVLNLGDDSPFTARYSWRPRRKLDIARLRDGAQRLVGTHDFSSFVVERSKIEDAIRTIYRVEVRQFGNYLCLTYIGNGFLYKMIRCLTGALEACASGKISPEEITRLLEAKNRSLAPETAPPHGLFLNKVFYDATELAEYTLTGVPFFR